MKIPRYYELKDYLKANKVLVIYGPRQIGKTTLLKDFLSTCKLKYKLESGDNIKVQRVLSSQDFDLIKEFVAGYDLIAIDEAQKISQVGLGLKILVDQMPNLKIIVTGSSSFELSGQIGEPLTGRKITLTLFPVSQIELMKIHNRHEIKEKLADWLIFGGYPEVVSVKTKNEKIQYLEEILNSYLLKDILELEKVKHSRVLLDLLRLLAFQIGNEVSLSELAGNLGIDYKTVARYIDLFEKSFVVYQLRGFSKNLRKEITKKSKYFFYDIGLRNAVISNFNALDLRNDQGALWENFLFMERLKKRAYHGINANEYFWRTWDQKEVDLVEERDGRLFGYEFKFKKKEVCTPREWLGTYKNASFEVVTPDNYLDFVT